jgi:hypothetical protein
MNFLQQLLIRHREEPAVVSDATLSAARRQARQAPNPRS